MKKRIISFLLAFVMLFSAAVCCGTAALAEETQSYDAEAQLNLIYSEIDKLLQSESTLPWYYTVTDLDHDGNLEFVAASQHPADRSTNLKIWEVSADRTALTMCQLAKEEDESFPDIMTDCADTFHDVETDTWSYLFYDNVILSDKEVYTIETSVTLKDGVVSYEAYALEHTVLDNSGRTIRYLDKEGAAISQNQYIAAAVDAFVGKERSSTSFDWFTESEAHSRDRLVDSYLVFIGVKEPTEAFPVPRPLALQGQTVESPAPAATAAPVVTPVPAKNTQPLYLSITKNPTNENRKKGSTALFVACANVYESLTWTFVSPNGGEYSTANFAGIFIGAKVTGQYSTTLSVENVSADMHGWGAYCTFYYKGQSARTSTAYIYVTDRTAPVPATPTPTVVEEGELYGSVIEFSYDSVTINVPGVDYYTLPLLWCRVSGELYVGAPATVYYSGRTARGVNANAAVIQGRESAPQPIYGSMNGTAYHDTAFTVYIVLNGVGYHIDATRINLYGGSDIEGAPCVAYYTDNPSEASIYQVDIFGFEPFVPEPEPVIEPEPYVEPAYEPTYGVINGTAFQSIEKPDKVELYLDNGEKVLVSRYSSADYTITIVGELAVAGGGNPCRVFYRDYPSAANIYEVQISAQEDAG